MEYRTFVPADDTDAVLGLRSHVWGAEHLHSTPQFVNWLLGDTAAGAGSGVMMLQGGEVVGFAGLLPRRMEIAGKVLPVAQCVDYMVHEQVRSSAGSFRIMSVWAKLARDRGFSFGIGFPNAIAHKIVTRSKLGWKEAFRPALMARPLSGAAVPGSLARWGTGALLRHGASVMSRLADARAGWNRHGALAGDVFPIDRFDARFDRLWNRAQAGPLSGIRRDADYLNWRFVQQPSYSYLRIGCASGADALGYAIASPRRLFGVESMLLVDFLTAADAPAHVGPALLGAIARRAQAQSISLLLALAISGSPLQAALRSVGFVTVPRPLNPKPFVMTVHDLGVPGNLPGFADWHFSWGDMDVV